MYTFLISLFVFCSSALTANAWKDDKGFYYHPHFTQQANIPDDSLYVQAELDRLAFWEKQALEIDWFKKWDNVLSWNPPYARWYEGGLLNISYNCLDRHLLKNANKLALIWCSETGEERKLTFADLHEEVCRLANGLKSLGIRKGDVVTIFMPMVPEGIAAMLACTRIGAVHSVVFGGTGSGALKERINDSQAKLVITSDIGFRRGKIVPYKDTLDQIVADCPSLENVVVFNRSQTDTISLSDGEIWYHDLVNQASPKCNAEPLDSEEMLFILYTSGTTGKPKGIIHTTGGYLVGVHNTVRWVFDPKPSDVYWCTADIGWITGHSYVVYGPMANGLTQLIYEGAFDFPEKDQAWKLIEKYRVSIFYTAPTLIRTFMKWGNELPASYDISSLRLIGSIGEPLNPEAWEWYHEYIGQKRCPIVDTWFQTETGALVISPMPGVTPLMPGSVAKALPGFEVDILDENGCSTSHGYLAITSPYPSMMRGLLNDPERYYNTYWQKWNGRFYYAGDFADKDSEGNIWVRGRADEVIKVAGHRIGTAEVENAIIEVPGVAEAAVVAVADEIKGEKIIALVVIKENVAQREGLEKLIIAAVANSIGKYAQPEKVLFISELPKTKSGKILRRVIKNMIEGKDPGNIATIENEEAVRNLADICEQIRSQLMQEF